MSTKLSLLFSIVALMFDLYIVEGITASCGNRAYYETYGTQNATGPAISRLIELGADIVGTTKTVQFANGDRPTSDWVDYHAPFTARGDMMTSPSGSSTGAGTSTGAHDWLDVGIGSDTGGSVRLPASVNGLYGIRPSVGAIDLTNVMPLSDVLDTAGYVRCNALHWRTCLLILTSPPYHRCAVTRSCSRPSVRHGMPRTRRLSHTRLSPRLY